MTQERDTESILRYHDLTKHSYWSVRSSPHYLDWANKPSPFKIYSTLHPLPLPRSLVQTLAPALEVVASTGAPLDTEKSPGLSILASVLYYSAGVTKFKRYPGGELYFRAAACAGALYPTEVYLVCGDIDGLDAGVYHFNPGDFALRKLRDGDFRGVLARATGEEAAVNSAPATLVFTSISWRSTWKYRDRAYRYHFWDNGMIIANALAMAAAHGLPAKVVVGFVESEVNSLIGIDGQRELALSLLALGHSRQALPGSPEIERLPSLDFDLVPISDSPVDYPLIREAHFASSLSNSEDVRDWRDGRIAFDSPGIQGEPFELNAIGDQNISSEPVEDVIQRRASTRRFARKPMPFSDVSTILERATRGIPADFAKGDGQLNDIYAIVNRVDGVPPGAYFFRRADRAMELLKPGEFSEKAAYLTLGQDLGGDACITLFFMTDLRAVTKAYGPRGYRLAQIEAGIVGGKVYLASYALRKGATGLTFFDDDVAAFFSPHAAGKSCMLVVSAGIAGKRPLA